MEVVQLKSEFAVDPIYVKGGYGPMDKYLLNSSLLFNDHIKAKQELSPKLFVVSSYNLFNDFAKKFQIWIIIII